MEVIRETGESKMERGSNVVKSHNGMVVTDGYW